MTDEQRYLAAYDWAEIERDRKALEKAWDDIIIAAMELDFVRG
jgi:hypothetical protein